MKRRTALKNIGATVSAGLILPSFISSCKEDEVKPEVDYAGTVAIIGAGAAGLYAADILSTKGIKVKLFEASDALGGRVRTVKTIDNSPIESDYPIELGAERIIGTDGKWATMIDELKIPVVDIDTLGKESYIINSKFTSLNEASGQSEFLNAETFYHSFSSRLSSNGSVESEVMSSGISTSLSPLVNSWIGNRFGSSDKRVGAKPVAETFSQLTRNKLERTLRSNPMQDVLVSRFSKIVPFVELNTVIKNINYSSGKVLLSGEKKTAGSSEPFTAEVDKVIITVPVSILKSGDITFTPALPQTITNAMINIAMDASIRLALDFKQNFWGSDVSYILGGETAPEYFSGGIGRSQLNKTLSITINGPKAEELSSKSDEQIVEDVLAELDKAFDGKGTANVRRDDSDKPIYMLRNWGNQPYIKGGISYVKPGGSIEDRNAISTPVQSLVFFAGEATHPIEAGTVNGALLSAERVATEVVTSIVGA